ncbi:M48 family metallopeptidase [Aquimarina sp. AU474]|uniref:tetratricopeptide repeat protein n=1 Tax=Aquimarina sp. AU474 TaxID=2108529 RepID=UPI000D691BA6|nr:hypothetical protein [Aquimarina sp. AU474]
MNRTKITILFLIANFCVVFPCFWDYDTIEMERQQFPSVIELISGKFLRHSPEFYYWRVKDREEKLKNSPDSLYLLDDLAVSYSKIGDNKKAIEIIFKKEQIQPGEYETYANLGTFYLHDGQFSKGIQYIEKAIAINPNAHFGREIYQLYVAQYVLGKMKDGKIPFPLSSKFRTCLACLPKPYLEDNFYTFLVDKHREGDEKSKRRLSKKELEKAIIGILGMMKFGNHDSPILLEVLGDLLVGAARKEGARQLAARAYFKASYKFENEKTKEVYRKKIIAALYHQYTKKRGKKFNLYELEELLTEEIEEGNTYYNGVRKDEMSWILTGKNPEHEFDVKYYVAPTIGIRIQNSKGEESDITKRYSRDTTIGKIIDYRPIPKQNILLSIAAKESIDSLFEKDLIKEERIPNNDGIEKKENPKTKYWVVALLLMGILGIGFWIWVRAKNNNISNR